MLGLAVALAVPAVASSANEVTKWNEIAVNTVNAQPPIASAPAAASIFVAMVQGAVYGAVNAVDRHGRPYLVNRSYPKASAEAAAATAAFRVLDTLFPAQHATLQAAYDASLAGIPNGALKATGIEVGTMAADAMLAEGHDGRVLISCTFGTFVPGVWQPLAGPTGDPACDPSPWVKDAKTFLVESAAQFRTPGPLALTSAAYVAEFNEVKAIGSLNSSTRTAAQSHAAAFWQTNPAANYNAIARRFADLYSLDLSDSARLFAMLDLAAADALITTWSDKYYYNFWRPRGRDPTGGHRRQSRHGGRPHLGADVPSDARSRDRRCRSCTWPAAVPGPPVGRHRLRQCQHERAGGVLRYRRGAVLSRRAAGSPASSGPLPASPT